MLLLPLPNGSALFYLCASINSSQVLFSQSILKQHYMSLRATC